MKTLLLQIPPYQLTSPALPTAKLVASLKSKGVTEVTQADLNIRCFEHYLDSVEDVLERVRSVLSTPRSQAPREVPGLRAVRKHSLTRAYLEWATDNIDQLPALFDGFRSDACLHNQEPFIRAGEALGRWCFLLDVAYGFRWSWRRFPSEIQTLGTVEEMWDPHTNPFLSYFVRELETGLVTSDTGLIGISISFAQQLWPGLTLGKLIRQRHPETAVVIGGSYISLLKNQILEKTDFFEYADAYVIGEGEGPLHAIVDSLARGRGIPDAPNVLKFGPNGVLGTCATGAYPFEYITPDFDDLPLSHYFAARLILPIVCTSNCYFARCTFCLHIKGRASYSRTSAERTAEMLRELNAKYGATHFYFCDNALPPSLVKQLTSALLSSNDQYYWYGDLLVAPNELSLEDLKLARQAGFLMAFVGFETFHDRLLTLLGKAQTAQQGVTFWRRLHAAGIAVKVNIILGLPTETESETRQTINTIRANQAAVDRIDAVAGLVVEEGTPMFETPERFGIKIGQRSPEVFSLAHPYEHETSHLREWIVAISETIREEAQYFSAEVLHPSCQGMMSRDHFVLMLSNAPAEAFLTRAELVEAATIKDVDT